MKIQGLSFKDKPFLSPATVKDPVGLWYMLIVYTKRLETLAAFSTGASVTVLTDGREWFGFRVLRILQEGPPPGKADLPGFRQACRRAEANRLGTSQERLALHQTEDCNGRHVQACIMGSMADVIPASGKGSIPV